MLPIWLISAISGSVDIMRIVRCFSIEVEISVFSSLAKRARLKIKQQSNPRVGAM